MAIELKDLTKRADNYSQWFNDLVVKADLAEQSAVRGCMVIKPYGYAIWEKMQPTNCGQLICWRSNFQTSFIASEFYRIASLDACQCLLLSVPRLVP